MNYAMARSKERIQARILRKGGESIKVIARKLNVSVGSVSLWVRDIRLTSEQEKNLQKRSTDALFGNKKAYLEKLKKKHAEKVHHLKQKGILKVGTLNDRDLFIAGLALYWGEGFKKDSLVGFATTDPNAARVFIRWMKKCFGINRHSLILRVTANLSYKDTVADLEEFWSKRLQIDRKCFSKPYFQKSKWLKEYENKEHYHGVIRIRVRKSIDVLREIQGAISAFNAF